MRRIYQEIASRLTAIENCQRRLDAEESNDVAVAHASEWLDKHADVVNALVTLGPSGSGVDSGFSIDHDKTRRDRIVLTTAFHHMTETGMYDGWTDHEVIVTPTLEFGYELRVTGRNRNDIKDYLRELFAHWLDLKVEVTHPEDYVMPKIEIISE